MKVVEVDEFNTSQKCPCCHGQLCEITKTTPNKSRRRGHAATVKKKRKLVMAKKMRAGEESKSDSKSEISDFIDIRSDKEKWWFNEGRHKFKTLPKVASKAKKKLEEEDYENDNDEEGAEIKKRVESKVYALKACKRCRNLYDRDSAASRNIAHCVLFDPLGEKRPRAFDKKKNVKIKTSAENLENWNTRVIRAPSLSIKSRRLPTPASGNNMSAHHE